MKKTSALRLTQAAMIAAIYVVLTYFISAFGLANGAIQVRISEALTILPIFTPAAIPGLFVGCLLSNILTGCMARRDIWQSGNHDRCDWHLSVKKDQVCLYLAAGDR